MNNLRIIETPSNNRFITYLKNSTSTHYGTILSFYDMRTQEMLRSSEKQSQYARLWVKELFTSKGKVLKLADDKIKKLTLDEYFKLEQIIKYANATYNKKKDRLILKKQIK